jgi:NADPH-dependent curcumin reductase CurA
MNDRKSYIPPFQVGQPLDGNAVGRVIESRHRLFPEGTWVSSFQGWREYFLSNGEGVNRIDPSLAPPSAWLGVLGIPGFTGWYGLREIGKPRAGETLVVSGAAGATGSLVGQMGKIIGCRVAGTAGSDDKCALLTKEYGFDEAINYKSAGDMHAALARACPNGVDVYFENVGGPILEAVLRLINPFARIVMCGMISQYNLAAPEPGPRYLFSLIPNRALMQGFIISDHFDRMPEFIREVGGWVKEGRIKYRETVMEGLENAPGAFIGLLTGQNTGKMVVRIGPGAGRA